MGDVGKALNESSATRGIYFVALQTIGSSTR